MKNTLLAFVAVILFMGNAITPMVKGNQNITYIGWVKKDISEVHHDKTYTVVHALFLRVNWDNGQFSNLWNTQVSIPCTMEDFHKLINSRPALVGYFVHITFHN